MENKQLNYAILRYIASIKDKDLPGINSLLNVVFEYITNGFEMEINQENDELYGKHDLVPLFQFEEYKKILNERDYFAGIEEGSELYKERELKAKERFYEKYRKVAAESKQDAALQLKDKGNQLFGQKDYPGAVDYYSQAITIWPTKNDFYSNRGLCYFNMGQFESAVEDYQKSLKLDPTVVKIYIRLGMALTELGRKDEAIVIYKQGLMYDPTSVYLRDPLRELLEEKGETLEEIPDMSNLNFSEMMSDPSVQQRMSEMQGMMGENNPMAAAFQMMENPEFRDMVTQVMSSPGFGDMMSAMMSGGGMPGMPGMPGFPGMPPQNQ